MGLYYLNIVPLPFETTLVSTGESATEMNPKQIFTWQAAHINSLPSKDSKCERLATLLCGKPPKSFKGWAQDLQQLNSSKNSEYRNVLALTPRPRLTDSLEGVKSILAHFLRHVHPR